MSTYRHTVRTAVVAATAGVITFAGAGSAFAHVTAQPEEAEKGGYEKVAFRVPNERPNASTVKIKVMLPADYPLASVRTKPMPGWSTEVEKVKLDKPVTSEGKEITEAVRSITWTAQPGIRVGPQEFEEFEATLGTLPENADQLVMPTQQFYDNGEVVNWDMPTPPGGEEPEHPAPTLKLVAKQPGRGHDHAAAGHDQGAPEHAEGDETARLLGGAGLAVGALGVGFGAGALLRNRKRQS